MTPDSRVGAPWVYWVPAVATAAFMAWLSHQPRLPDLPAEPPDWFLHQIEYAFFTLTCVYGITRGFAHECRTASRVAAAVLIASLYGVTDEWHQSFVGRDATVRDWGADTVGALLMAFADPDDLAPLGRREGELKPVTCLRGSVPRGMLTGFFETLMRRRRYWHASR